MKSLQRKYDLIDDAKELEISLLREYFNEVQADLFYSKIFRLADLIVRAQARIERRRNAYLAAAAATTKELGRQWPSLEDMPDGDDVFPDLPISGGKEC